MSFADRLFTNLIGLVVFFVDTMGAVEIVVVVVVFVVVKLDTQGEGDFI